LGLSVVTAAGPLPRQRPSCKQVMTSQGPRAPIVLMMIPATFLNKGSLDSTHQIIVSLDMDSGHPDSQYGLRLIIVVVQLGAVKIYVLRTGGGAQGRGKTG
jgi:hypothetical protein